jgi:HSP20 family protein
MTMNSTNDKSEPARTPPPALRGSDVWRPFQQLRTQIDRAFEELAGNWHLPWARSGEAAERDENLFSTTMPAVDLTEKDDCYMLTAELPGLDEKDIEVSCSNGHLIIRGEKSAEREEKKPNYYLSERRYGSFQRAFQLPPEVAIEKIEARYKKGVLKLTLPKRPDAVKPSRRIDIKSD